MIKAFDIGKKISLAENSEYGKRYISKKTRITGNLQPAHGLCCGIHEKM